MRGSRKFCQRGSNFDNVFFSWWGEGGYKSIFKRAIIGPQAKRRFAGMPMNAQHRMLASQLRFFRGSGPVLLENPVFLWFFRGWGGSGPPVPLSGTAHVIPWYFSTYSVRQRLRRACASVHSQYSIDKHHRFYVEWINFVSQLGKRPFCI